MENNTQAPLPTTAATTAPAPAYPGASAAQAPYQQLMQQQQQHLQMFWAYQRQEIEQCNDFKNHQLPLARIKKIMKADEDVRMISAEAPVLFAKACELFILELTIRSWLHAEENKRRTLQKNDIAAAITRTDIFDFLVDIVPRDEINRDDVAAAAAVAAVGGGFGPGAGPAYGMPYNYPPIGQPAPPPGVMMGRPAMDPAGMFVPPSQAWQSVWQQNDDASYAAGAGAGGGGGGANGAQPNHG